VQSNDYLKIGVLGGMSPEARADFYRHIIKLFQTELNVRHNFEYPEMLIHNIPSPDNVESGVNHELAEYLLNSVSLLEKAGMQLLAIPCNSAHVHIDAVIKASTVQVMNILEETAKAVHSANANRVLLLGTASTIGYGIYEPYLQHYGIDAVTPNPEHQDEVTRAIMAVCDGSVSKDTRSSILAIIDSCPDIQGVVLGCTEIPAIIGQDDMDIQCFDTAKILARATFDRCCGT
jgi:aspartate racemase